MSFFACRMRAGLSQEDVVLRTGCAGSSVQHWDHGVVPSKHYITYFCKLFGVTRGELLREEPRPTPDMEKLLTLANDTERFLSLTGIDPGTVRGWRSGAVAQIGTLRLISSGLGVPIASLLTIETEETR